MHTTHLETDLEPAVVTNGVLGATLARQQMSTYRVLASPASLPLAVPFRSADRLRLVAFPVPVRSGNAARVSFRLPAQERVTLRVCDLRGATIATLCDRSLAAGEQQFSWDRRDARGQAVRAGVYFVLLETPSAQARTRVVVLE